ncbi:MAG: hypothetical protein LDL26_10020 [Caenispirillum bisanense]|nr:hypothetical protein [Caenispirillum bisanense]MCA1974135.1 hypothetical protein [Caenispirillum sp.]
MRRPVPAVTMLAAAVAVLALAACADGDAQPHVVTSGGLAIALEDDDDALARAVETANRHCVESRRVAVLQTVSEINGERLAFFECVDV